MAGPVESKHAVADGRKSRDQRDVDRKYPLDTQASRVAGRGLVLTGQLAARDFGSHPRVVEPGEHGRGQHKTEWHERAIRVEWGGVPGDKDDSEPGDGKWRHAPGEWQVLRESPRLQRGEAL